MARPRAGHCPRQPAEPGVTLAPLRTVAARWDKPRRSRTACPAWPQADLLRRIRQAIALTRRTLQVAIAQGDGPQHTEDTRPGGTRPLNLEKVVGEAAMLARCAFLANAGDAALNAEVDGLARDLAPQARGESVQARICADPAGAVGHASAHVCLSDIGHRDARFERFLQEVRATDLGGGPERLPNQLLEWHWLECIGRSASHDPANGLRVWLAQTCASRPLDVLCSSTIDLYLFTHVVLYASDMGQRAVQWPRDPAQVVAESDASLAAALDAENFDLAAELLWTWPMLGLQWSATAEFAFELLSNVQDEHGFLPGPEFRLAHSLALSASQRDDYMLRTSYHATLVMGLLCAASGRSGRRPTRRVAMVAGGAGCGADPLLGLLPNRSCQPRWLALHATRCGADRAALAPLLINVGLRRAAAAGDLGQLGRILESALRDAAWSELPAVQQAAALLLRASALARLRQR